MIKPSHFPKLTRRPKYSKGKKYTDFRAEIREDCLQRCVYCDSHENVLGGQEAMQLDHFQPKSLFPGMEHDPLNLLWVCSRCNRLKWYDWPPSHPNYAPNGKTGYIDPFAIDRKIYFEVGDDGTLTALVDPALYMIHRLKLNRDFLIFVRHYKNKLYDWSVKCERFFAEHIAKREALLTRTDLNEEQIREIKREMEEFVQIKGIVEELLNMAMTQIGY